MVGYKIVIIGLGYISLPLAVEFGIKIETLSFDIHTFCFRHVEKQSLLIVVTGCEL